MRWRAEIYLGSAKEDAVDELLESCLIGVRRRSRRLSDLLRAHLGNSAHLWMYDFPRMATLVAAAGFCDIRRCDFGDAAGPMFALVEEHDRFIVDGRRELAIEAVLRR
ncbi:MAG: hypothetical protein WDM85_18545 [Caulobacteraceae bacterium]